MITKLKGKSLQELIESGSKLMAPVPSGGAAAASAPAAGGQAAVSAEAPKKEEKKVVEEDVDMGDLFGGGDDY